MRKIMAVLAAFALMGAMLVGCGNNNNIETTPHDSKSSASNKHRIFVATTSVYRDDKNDYSSTTSYQLDKDRRVQKTQEESTYDETPSIRTCYYLSGNMANEISDYYKDVVNGLASEEILLDRQAKLEEKLLSTLGDHETLITLFIIKDGFPQYMQFGSKMDGILWKAYDDNGNVTEYGGYTFNSLGLFKHSEGQYFYDETGKEVKQYCEYNDGKEKRGLEFTYDLNEKIVQQRNIAYTDISEETAGYVKYTYDQNGNRIIAESYDKNWNPTGSTSKYIRDEYGNLTKVMNYQDNIMHSWTEYIYTEVFVPEDSIPFLTAIYDWYGIAYNITK